MKVRYYIALAMTVPPVLAWIFFQLAVIVRGPNRACPRCGGRRTRHSFRRLRDRILPAFIAPRRCISCLKRFHTLQSFDYTYRVSPQEGWPSDDWVPEPWSRSHERMPQ